MKEGGDLKKTLAAKEKNLDELRSARDRSIKAVGSLGKSISYELATLRSQAEHMRKLVQEDMMPSLQAFVTQSTLDINGRITKIVDSATRELLAKYRFEVMQRKIIYNKLQELKGMPRNDACKVVLSNH